MGLNPSFPFVAAQCFHSFSSSSNQCFIFNGFKSRSSSFTVVASPLTDHASSSLPLARSNTARTMIEQSLNIAESAYAIIDSRRVHIISSSSSRAARGRLSAKSRSSSRVISGKAAASKSGTSGCSSSKRRAIYEMSRGSRLLCRFESVGRTLERSSAGRRIWAMTSELVVVADSWGRIPAF